MRLEPVHTVWKLPQSARARGLEGRAMSVSELSERIAELAARIAVARYEMLTLVREFDQREGWAADGFETGVDWLAWRIGVSPATAREHIRVAYALPELPRTSKAMKRGLISYTKVREITRAGTPENEAALLEYAQAGSAVKLRRMVLGWKRFGRDGEVDAEEHRHRSRHLSVAVDDEGMYVVRGRLEPEAGAVLLRALEAASDAAYREEDAEARPTGAQRRADAAGLMAERALVAGFGGGVESGSRAERYQVVVHTEAATLAENGEPGRSELDGVRVCAETSRRLACDASVVPMVHGGGGEVLNVGRKTRTVPVHIRRALEERDRGCRYPGCGSRFTDAHHVRHWADGGETSLANLVLLCRRHHRAVHEGRSRMGLDLESKAVFFSRTGQVIGSAPPPRAATGKLPPAPPEPPGRLWNGAARFKDWAMPWKIVRAAREGLDP